MNSNKPIMIGYRAYSKKQPGFTLLELLVAVAIFAGIAVLTLAIFARTAASSVKTSVSRQRTEAARTAVDKITNDFRYIYLDKEITNQNTAQIQTCFLTGGPTTLLGYQFSSNTNCLEMVLQYPGSTDLIWKKYSIETDNGVNPPRSSLFVQELRACQLDGANHLVNCQPSTRPLQQDMLMSRYQFEITNPVFKGLSPKDAKTTNSNGILTILLSLKPSDQSQSCVTSDTQCYTIKTTLNAGGI